MQRVVYCGHFFFTGVKLLKSGTEDWSFMMRIDETMRSMLRGKINSTKKEKKQRNKRKIEIKNEKFLLENRLKWKVFLLSYFFSSFWCIVYLYRKHLRLSFFNDANKTGNRTKINNFFSSFTLNFSFFLYLWSLSSWLDEPNWAGAMSWHD